MKYKNTLSLMMALILSVLLVAATQTNLYAEAPIAPAYIDLDAVQLDQLVAPIALDPDPLVAQILTASTYPDQVSAADTWLNQNMNLRPEQRADAANNMSWDPSVKGLIEFPSTLDSLAKNSAWTSQLGNAYYNQPGDVMNAVQAMRSQAQEAKVLVTTVRERVVVEAGLIEILPVDPAVIYVPYYNPWRIWGTLFVAYPGFVVLPPPAGVVWEAGLGFDPGVAVGVYAGYGWGFGAWAPAWDGGTVLFNNSTYISESVSVCNHGYFGGHDRGVFDHEGRGVPRGFHGHAHPGAARNAAARAHHGLGKPSAGRPFAGGREPQRGGHSPLGGRGANPGHSAATAHRGGASTSHGRTTASRGGLNANHGSNRGTNHGTTTASHGNANASRGRTAASAKPSSNPSSNHGSASASRGNANTSHGTSMARGGAGASHGNSTTNRGSASANRGSSNRGTSMARNGAGGNTSHGNSTTNRGSASANRGSSNRGTSMARNGAGGNTSHGNSTPSRGNASANRSSSNRGSSMARNGAGGNASHGNSMARGGAPAGHSGGGGHASSGGRGKGR